MIVLGLSCVLLSASLGAGRVSAVNERPLVRSLITLRCHGDDADVTRQETVMGGGEICVCFAGSNGCRVKSPQKIRPPIGAQTRQDVVLLPPDVYFYSTATKTTPLYTPRVPLF